jgi:hypothetical protein
MKHSSVMDERDDPRRRLIVDDGQRSKSQPQGH